MSDTQSNSVGYISRVTIQCNKCPMIDLYVVEECCTCITIYALTFAVFANQQLSVKVSSRENLDLSGNESAFVRRLHNKHAKMATIH